MEGKKRVKYNDYENKKVIPYECPRNTLADKHYCEFHDSDYAQTNPDDVIKSFYTLMELRKNVVKTYNVEHENA